MKDLIVKSATATEKAKNPEMDVINQLGKCFEKFTVSNEKDCIKFKQKAWIEREVWREINAFSGSTGLTGCQTAKIAAGER